VPLGYVIAAIAIVWYLLRIGTNSFQWFDAMGALAGFIMLMICFSADPHMTGIEIWNVSAMALSISAIIGVPLMILHVMVFGAIKAVSFRAPRYR
jgi:hypothetical protein